MTIKISYLNSVMEYFALSVGPQGFYDRSCNNEVCKMQGITGNAVADALK